jgi:DNA-binding NarL/FixJ family response regulator
MDYLKDSMTEPKLTAAEEEVVSGLAKGWSCSTIAGWLGIKKKTVYAHILNIANKLGANPDHTKPFQRVVTWAARRRENAA